MPNLVLDLIVDRVDLVDEGANSAAFIQLYKRKENQQAMTLEEILAKMKPEHADVVRAELTKAKGEIPGEIQQKLATTEQDLAKAREDLRAKEEELESLKKSKEPQPSFEEVVKGLDPTVQEMFKSLRAQKEAAEELARQAAEKQANEEAMAKARELKALPVEEAKLVEMMKGISPEVFELLKAANQALENGQLFTEVGKSKPNAAGTTSSADEAWEKIEKKAAEIATEEKVTKAKAISLAIKRYPDLYREYLNGGAN